MAKKINIEAAINEVKFVCGHYAASIENVPTSNRILVHIDLKSDGYKQLAAMSNFNLLSAHVVENRVLSHGMAPTNYLVGTYEPKRGKFTA